MYILDSSTRLKNEDSILVAAFLLASASTGATVVANISTWWDVSLMLEHRTVDLPSKVPVMVFAALRLDVLGGVGNVQLGARLT
jgi:hypothetical protein